NPLGCKARVGSTPTPGTRMMRAGLSFGLPSSSWMQVELREPTRGGGSGEVLPRSWGQRAHRVYCFVEPGQSRERSGGLAPLRSEALAERPVGVRLPPPAPDRRCLRTHTGRG